MAAASARSGTHGKYDQNKNPIIIVHRNQNNATSNRTVTPEERQPSRSASSLDRREDALARLNELFGGKK